MVWHKCLGFLYENIYSCCSINFPVLRKHKKKQTLFLYGSTPWQEVDLDVLHLQRHRQDLGKVKLRMENCSLVCLQIYSAWKQDERKIHHIWLNNECHSGVIIFIAMLLLLEDSLHDIYIFLSFEHFISKHRN